MPQRFRIAPLVLSAGLLACAHQPRPAVNGQAEVRAERERYNAAIGQRDTALIASLLLPSYHSVSGRSVQRHGPAAALEFWVSVFRDSTVGYRRQPDTIEVNEEWGLAAEFGEWTGHVTAADGPARSSGVYAAKWQRARDRRWRLQSEVFTTLACKGGPLGCPPPEPVND